MYECVCVCVVHSVGQLLSLYRFGQRCSLYECVRACMVNSFRGLTAYPVQMGGVGVGAQLCAPGTSASVSPESSCGQERRGEGEAKRGEQLKGKDMEAEKGESAQKNEEAEIIQEAQVKNTDC